MVRFTDIFSVLARTLAVTLCALAVACSADKEGEPVKDSQEGELQLQLDISVLGTNYARPYSQTRVAEPDDYVNGANKYENLHHLRVIIVNKEDGVIVHNRGILFENNKPVADNMKFKLKCDNDYTIYLLGNCDGFESQTDFGIDNLPVGDVYPSGLIEGTLLEAAEGVVFIDNTGSEREYVPMTEKFGIHTDAYTGALGQSQYEHFFITRALTKFGFSIHPSEDFTGDELPPITSIRLSGLADKVYLLPNGAVYNPPVGTDSNNKEQGREIVSFNTPSDVITGSHNFTLPTPLDITAGIESWVWTPSLYFAESALTDKGIECTISFDNGAEWLVPVQLPNLPYGLPRNSFVKIDITIGNNNAFLVQVIVEPWTTVVSNFDYADEVNIATDGALSLVTGTYKSLDKNTGRVVINDNQSPITGNFGIATPVGMPWVAYLVTENGVTDAIQFKLPDGTTSSSISGIIGADSKAEFQIVPVVSPGETPNTAILIVVVTTSDGRSVPANILFGAGYSTDVQYLTVIQNPS
ncbi:MAG: hypothetical protein K2H86_05945 [Muribaculaceae bacterium]|nr:hypothetical protein [Muribaculaceae bacterium]